MRTKSSASFDFREYISTRASGEKARLYEFKLYESRGTSFRLWRRGRVRCGGRARGRFHKKKGRHSEEQRKDGYRSRVVPYARVRCTAREQLRAKAVKRECTAEPHRELSSRWQTALSGPSIVRNLAGRCPLPVMCGMKEGHSTRDREGQSCATTSSRRSARRQSRFRLN